IQLVEDGVEVETTSLRVDEMTTLDLQNRGEVVLSSSHALTVFASIGEAGAAYVMPNAPEPADKRGHAWSVPL
ncbi:MAG: hypothetical protein ACPGDD_05560, partial [Poseidonia sp.]